MVRRKGNEYVHGYGCHPPSPPPAFSLWLILKPRQLVRSEKFLMEICSKAEATDENLFEINDLPVPERGWKNLLGGGGGGIPSEG